MSFVFVLDTGSYFVGSDNMVLTVYQASCELQQLLSQLIEC